MTTSIAAQGAVTSKSVNNIAFYYHPDGYETERANLMGRHAAGDGFLQGFCRYSGVELLNCYAEQREHFEHFVKRARDFSELKHTYRWIPWTRWQDLSEVGCLFVPGPDLSNLAWQRRHGNQRAFSLFGITHTTASARIMDGLGQLLTAPLQPWDAVICTSQSVKTMMQRVVGNYSTYLQEKFGLQAAPAVPAQFPVIPLGVNCAAFDLPADRRASLRKQWREKLQIADDDIAALYVGRLSFHAKAHPLPMYKGLELAAQKTKKKVHLILSGWFPNKAIENEFAAAAKRFCPSVTVHMVDGRQPVARQTIWFAADLFTSLADNIQETFGLTPIEAMAAGLPVVVSDWDGYKETVRQGVDGFRISTWIPPVGQAGDVALAHAMGAINYDRYIGYQSQFTAVDIGECAQAYQHLMENPSLRLQMGVAGRERARAVYDWSVIVGAYQQLGKELAKLRQSATEHCQRQQNGAANPLRDDPGLIFGHYATNILKLDTATKLSEYYKSEDCGDIQSLDMNMLGSGLRYTGEDLEQLLSILNKDGEVRVQELYSGAPMENKRRLLYTLVWLSKMGIVSLT